MDVSGRWIKDNIGWNSALIDIKQLVENEEKYQTNLTKYGIQNVEMGLYAKTFVIVLPGHGIINVKAKGY